MEIVAIIPARGGSKGIPRKNVRRILGQPLIVYSIQQALRTSSVSRVIVTTDDEEIASVARRHGSEVIRRPAAISDDTATSESALVHCLEVLRDEEGYEPDLVVFLQATSPYRHPTDISNALAHFADTEADSLFSASPLHGFVWRIHTDRSPESLTYDYRARTRRQEGPHDVVENGSIYIFKPWVLQETQNRLGGKIATYTMDAARGLQIDDPEDLILLEAVMQSQGAPSLPPPDFSDLRLLVLDFDGVLTDNKVVVSEGGGESVLCHRGDGYGIEQVRALGIEVLVLSREKNPVVAARCKKLGITHHQHVLDKLPALQNLVEQRHLTAAQVAYVGNDVNDLDCLRWVGTPIGVADAHVSILDACSYLTHHEGGQGAVREVCDMILEQFRTE